MQEYSVFAHPLLGHAKGTKISNNTLEFIGLEEFNKREESLRPFDGIDELSEFHNRLTRGLPGEDTRSLASRGEQGGVGFSRGPPLGGGAPLQRESLRPGPGQLHHRIFIFGCGTCAFADQERGSEAEYPCQGGKKKGSLHVEDVVNLHEGEYFRLRKCPEFRGLTASRIACRAKEAYRWNMTMLADDSQVMSKTKELCAAIAGDPEYRDLLKKVELFLGDDAAKLQFQSVQERSQELGEKQRSGLDLSAGEVQEFEEAREALMENSVARNFMDAQQSLQSVQMVIGKYVGMTLELGRVPAGEDLALQDGCCGGGGCGC